MSGDIHRVKDFPDKAFGNRILLDKITVFRDRQGILTAKGGDCLIDRNLFERISDYTRSQPTGPSPGRVYRKALHWTALVPSHASFGEDPNWFLFLCVPTPDSRPEFKGSVDHVPFKVSFLDETSG